MSKETYNFASKLHLAASKDELRPVMGCIHFINGYAYVSDGYILIKQNLIYSSILDSENLEGKSLHRDTFKEVLVYDTVTAKKDGLECTDNEGRKTFFAYQAHDKERIPNFEKLLEDFEVNPVEFIGFKPSFLKVICDSIFGAKEFGVKVQFNGISKGMLISVPGFDEQQAFLMPLLLNETLF